MEDQLGGDLTFCVQRYWVQGRSFVQNVVTGSIYRTGTHKDKSSDTEALGNLRDGPGSGQVDLNCKVLIQGTSWVAHYASEVDDRIDSLHGGNDQIDLAKISPDNLEIGMIEEFLDWLLTEKENIKEAYAVPFGE